MSAVLIITIALWTYPILAWLSIRHTKDNLLWRKRILLTPLVLSGLVILCATLNVSMISENANFLLCTIIYFSAAQLLLLLFTFKSVILKILAGLLMFCVFGAGYITSTVGLLGLMFIIEGIQTDKIIKLSDNLVYKQYDTGNALSDYRNIEIDIYRTSKWIPGFEKRIFTKRYNLLFTNGHK